MSMPIATRVRLSVMMFLQYAIHAVWIMPLAAYLGGKEMGFTGGQIANVANAAPWGALLAPIFVGMIADRFFSSEKVLAILNVIGGGLLFWASMIGDPWFLFAVLLVQQLCYMPTWAITNSIAIANCADTEKDLPSIRVFGSIGWVATAVFGLVCAKQLNLFGIATLKMLNIPWDGTPKPMVAGAVLSVVAGLFALVLPHTPPPAAGKKSSLSDILGLKALALLKKPSFAVFILVSLVGMIPFAAYWTFFSLYLSSLGVTVITGTMNLGQVIEILAMAFLLPIALKKLGVKWTLVIGMATLGVRYLCFMLASDADIMALNYAGILVHGVIFSFFFVTGYIYSDRVAPKEIRAQAQSLIMLVTFGAGMLLGNWINGKIVDDNAIIGEPVAATFKLPALPGMPKTVVAGAQLDNVRLYGRVLNDDEIAVLSAQAAGQTKKVERLKKGAKSVKLDEKLLFEGKMDALSAPGLGKEMTFCAQIALPKAESDDAKPLSGTFFQLGSGDQALSVGLKNGKIQIRAGKTVLAQKVPMPRAGKEDEKLKKVHVAGVFDGKQLKLYTDGVIHKRWQWRKVWTYPAVISGILLVLMILLFHVPKEAPAAEEAGEPAAQEEPLEQELAEDTPAVDGSPPPEEQIAEQETPAEEAGESGAAEGDQEKPPAE